MELSNLSPLEQAEAREREASIAFDRSAEKIFRLASDVLSKLYRASEDIESAVTSALSAKSKGQAAGATLDEISDLYEDRLIHLENTISGSISAISNLSPLGLIATMTATLLRNGTELQQARIATVFERSKSPTPENLRVDDPDDRKPIEIFVQCTQCGARYGNYHTSGCVFAGSVVR